MGASGENRPTLELPKMDCSSIAELSNIDVGLWSRRTSIISTALP